MKRVGKMAAPQAGKPVPPGAFKTADTCFRPALTTETDGPAQAECCLALCLTTAPSRSRLRTNVAEPRASASGIRDTTAGRPRLQGTPHRAPSTNVVGAQSRMPRMWIVARWPAQFIVIAQLLILLASICRGQTTPALREI